MRLNEWIRERERRRRARLLDAASALDESGVESRTIGDAATGDEPASELYQCALELEQLTLGGAFWVAFAVLVQDISNARKNCRIVVSELPGNRAVLVHEYGTSWEVAEQELASIQRNLVTMSVRDFREAYEISKPWCTSRD
jgi:hypothetical protein